MYGKKKEEPKFPFIYKQSTKQSTKLYFVEIFSDLC